jgi:tetratricopeptide (TPR) repeat protein
MRRAIEHSDTMTLLERFVFVVVTVIALVTTGCGGGVLGHGVPLMSPKTPAAAGNADQLREARERSVTEPGVAYWPFRAGEILAAKDSVAQAESMLRVALDRDPSYAPALSLQSRLWFDAGRHQEAITLLEAARARPGAFPQELLVGLALHYDAIDRPDQARALLASAGKPEDRSRSGVVYLALRGAVSDSVAGVKKNDIDGGAKTAAEHNNLGIVKLRSGDPVGARKAFQAAIDKDPKLAGPYYNLAILEKFYLLDDEAADRWFRAYRQRSNEDPDSLFAVFGKGASKKLAQEDSER